MLSGTEPGESQPPPAAHLVVLHGTPSLASAATGGAPAALCICIQ